MTAWEAAVKADKTIGGDKLGENLALAAQALDAFGSAELKQVLRKSGFGSHPEVIKAFVKIGQQVADSKLVTGRVGHETGDGQPQSAVDRLSTIYK